jgi:hypothetical protein
MKRALLEVGRGKINMFGGGKPKLFPDIISQHNTPLDQFLSVVLKAMNDKIDCSVLGCKTV